MDIITFAISSTQIACDVMCVQYVINNFYIVYSKKTIFFYKEFFFL